MSQSPISIDKSKFQMSIKNAFSDVSGYGSDIERVVSSVVFEGGLAIHKTINDSIARSPKTGNKYGAVANRGAYTASAPGEAPANATGKLLSSVSVNKSKSKSSASSFVSITASYARALEYGHKNKGGKGGSRGARRRRRGGNSGVSKSKPASKGYTEPRPFAKPARDKWEPKIKLEATLAINKVLK